MKNLTWVLILFSLSHNCVSSRARIVNIMRTDGRIVHREENYEDRETYLGSIQVMLPRRSKEYDANSWLREDIKRYKQGYDERCKKRLQAERKERKKLRRKSTNFANNYIKIPQAYTMNDEESDNKSTESILYQNGISTSCTSPTYYEYPSSNNDEHSGDEFDINKNSTSNNFPNDCYKEKDSNIIAGFVAISLACLLGIGLYLFYDEKKEDKEETS